MVYVFYVDQARIAGQLKFITGLYREKNTCMFITNERWQPPHCLYICYNFYFLFTFDNNVQVTYYLVLMSFFVYY